MKITNPFRDLTAFELGLWITSMAVTVISFIFSGVEDPLTAIASLIGVTALIFVAKGYVLGQILTVAFAVFYGIISFYMRYYGEMITYLCMSAPSAIAATVSWIRNPYKGSKEVKVESRLSKAHTVGLILSSAAVTVTFYFILGALGNASLITSTLSVATSFTASYLTFCRSPYYAVAYAFNDVVLIVLWTIATVGDISYLPMVMCFVMFLANDVYGFINWRRMQKRQA